MKKLRKNIDKEIRFYGCGEYGQLCATCGKNETLCWKSGCNKFKEQTVIGRPHYHACIFNYDFPDKVFWRYSKDGSILYRSEKLEEIWEKGFSTIGEVTFKSAGYIARYISKKITGKPAKNHYKGRLPEFQLMSRMPGLGRPWIEKYFNDVYPKDFFTIEGKRHKPPRYYDSYLDKRDPDLLIKIKEKRKQAIFKKIEKQRVDPTHNWRRPAAQERHKKLITKSLKRSLENEC